MSLNNDVLNFNNAIKILTSQGKFHICLGLERMQQIMHYLGNPQDSLNVIHVAGTNGKGSTCAMLCSILEHAGYKTGLYTSPHLVEYTERIKAGGADIPKQDFVSIFNRVLNLAQEKDIHLTEFEILTAVAFLYFKECGVDLVVLETGLGGRLDATNIISQPLISVITQIDIDHIDRLGDTVEKIAAEKAGIIKKNRPVVISPHNIGFDVVKKKAQEYCSDIVLADKNFKLINTSDNVFSSEDEAYSLSLLGVWQGQNLSLVLKTIEILNKQNYNIDRNSITQGLNNTVWPARMQYLKQHNMVIDGAHNLIAARLLKQSIDLYFPNVHKVWLYGSLATKDYKSIIESLFSPDDIVICTQGNSMSPVGVSELRSEISRIIPEKNIIQEECLVDAVNLLLNYKSEGSLLVVAGSLYLAGDVIKAIN